MSHLFNKEDIVEAAEKLGLKVSFNASDDEMGFWINGNRVSFDEIFEPFLSNFEKHDK